MGKAGNLKEHLKKMKDHVGEYRKKLESKTQSRVNKIKSLARNPKGFSVQGITQRYIDFMGGKDYPRINELGIMRNYSKELKEKLGTYEKQKEKYKRRYKTLHDELKRSGQNGEKKKYKETAGEFVKTTNEFKAVRVQTVKEVVGSRDLLKESVDRILMKLSSIIDNDNEKAKYFNADGTLQKKIDVVGVDIKDFKTLKDISELKAELETVRKQLEDLKKCSRRFEKMAADDSMEVGVDREKLELSVPTWSDKANVPESVLKDYDY